MNKKKLVVSKFQNDFFYFINSIGLNLHRVNFVRFISITSMIKLVIIVVIILSEPILFGMC